MLIVVNLDIDETECMEMVDNDDEIGVNVMLETDEIVCIEQVEIDEALTELVAEIDEDEEIDEIEVAHGIEHLESEVMLMIGIID